MHVIVSNVFGKFTDYNRFIEWSTGVVLILIPHGSVRRVWRSTWAMEGNLVPYPLNKQLTKRIRRTSMEIWRERMRVRCLNNRYGRMKAGQKLQHQEHALCQS